MLTAPGRAVARWLRRRLLPGAPILLYHRVAALERDPQLLAVTPDHFAEHLEVLRRESRVSSLVELDDALGRRDARGRVALTFDDGYADNLEFAAPLLRRFDTPATVFVASGQTGTRDEFWWDELDRVLLGLGELPPSLRLEIAGSTREWCLDDDATYPDEQYTARRRWSMLDAPPGRRQAIYRELCGVLRPLPPVEQQALLAALRAWAGVGDEGRSENRAMTRDEVARLAADGLVEIGAHTVRHPALATRTVEEQRREIRDSKAHLEEILGRPVTSFAYPYGVPRAHYTDATVRLVREAGFDRACSNTTLTARPGDDRFQINRLLVRDWEGDEFARRLREWFRA